MFEKTEQESDVRKCYSCNELKTLENFYKDGTHKDGTTRYRRDCKTCYRKTRMATKKPKVTIKQGRRRR